MTNEPVENKEQGKEPAGVARSRGAALNRALCDRAKARQKEIKTMTDLLGTIHGGIRYARKAKVPWADIARVIAKAEGKPCSTSLLKKYCQKNLPELIRKKPIKKPNPMAVNNKPIPVTASIWVAPTRQTVGYVSGFRDISEEGL
jgi:hypothetical protein